MAGVVICVNDNGAAVVLLDRGHEARESAFVFDSDALGDAETGEAEIDEL
jgi:hypothetical protein